MAPHTPQADDGPAARQRSRLACNHCKFKKLKCDSNEPSCHNCISHGRACVRHTVIQRPRPTHKRIHELEEETRILKEALSRLTPREPRSPIQDGGEAEHNVSEQQQQDFSGDSGGHPYTQDAELPQTPTRDNAAEAPETTQSSYHGPTSAIFDEHPPRHPEDLAVDGTNLPISSESWQRYYLVAQSAKQRQLESIHCLQGALDFDGVEKSLAMELLSIWWSRQLHFGLPVSRPLFMRDMACRGPCFSKLLLNAIYFASSKHSSSPEIRRDTNDISTAGWSFRRRFQSLLTDCFDRSSITTIQALLIVASTLFSRCDERSTSWLYAGLAFNMITDLGLHTCSNITPAQPLTSMEIEEQENRRRTYWAAYSIDKMQCLFQGRPPNLRLLDTNLPRVVLDDYEEFEAFDAKSYQQNWTLTQTPCYRISLLEQYRELSIVLERLLTHLYPGYGYAHSFDAIKEHSETIIRSLQDWRKSLPTHLDFLSSDSSGVLPLPHSVTLLSLYSALVILACRPLISDVRAHEGPPSIVHDALLACISAANGISHLLQVYARFYRTRSVPYPLSYATYVAANIYVRVLAQSSSFPEAADSLQICLTALEEQQHLYAAAKRAYGIIRALMRRRNVTLTDYTSHSRVGCEGTYQEVIVHSPEESSCAGPAPTSNIDVWTEQESPWINNEPGAPSLPIDFDFDVALQTFIQEQDFSNVYTSISSS